MFGLTFLDHFVLFFHTIHEINPITTTSKNGMAIPVAPPPVSGRRTGTGVGVGTGIAVDFGLGLEVGGMAVGSGVSVGIGVSVGSGVSVGGMGVSVGSGVSVGGMGVSVGHFGVGVSCWAKGAAMPGEAISVPTSRMVSVMRTAEKPGFSISDATKPWFLAVVWVCINHSSSTVTL